MEGDHHHYSLHLVDETMMDGHDDDTNNNHNNIWDVVDSWLNLDPQEVSHDDHLHGSAIVDGSSMHDDHQNQRNVVGSDGFDGGDEGKSMSDQGMENECEVEVQEDDDDKEDQLPLQIVWPSVPVPDSCSSCQVLREIVHTKGTHTTKLEIHGKVGIISHAIHSSHGGLAASDIQNQHMLDFSRQNLIDIKEYLKDYLEEHGENGCTLLQEPLSLYYEALTTGYNWRNFDHHDHPYSQGNNAAGETSDQATNLTTADDRRETIQQAPTAFRSELAIQENRGKG